MSADNQSDERVAVPLVWAGVEDVPIVFGNAFVCQFDQDLETFIITAGQMAPPVFVGTPDEMREQAKQIEFLQVKPIFRLSLSPSAMQELRSILGANVDQLERARTMRPGDPR